MRQIIYQTVLDSTTFQVKAKVVQKTAEGEIITLYNEPLDLPENKDTPAEQAKIDFCNRVLTNNGQGLLTENEIEFMLDPAGMNKRLKSLAEEMEDPEVLQRMAGFKVEKVITPLD